MTVPAQLLDMARDIDGARSPRDAGARMFAMLRPFGARGFFAGSFSIAPHLPLQDRVAGHQVLARHTPPAWLDTYLRRGLDEGNPVILALGKVVHPFRWSDGGLPRLRGWKGLQLAREVGMADGLAVPCVDRAGRAGVMSIGFERFAFSPAELRMIQFLALVTFERMRSLTPEPVDPAAPSLTPKERDCLAFVAEGRSDADIGDLLGIAPTTVHWHVENAKRKLGARTRAQAVARFHALGLL